VPELVLSDFADHLHHSFEVSAGATGVTLELMEAAALKAFSPGRPVPFSLTFRGPVRPQLAQGTYQFAHPRLGPTPIFIVPIAADENGVSYQAIFS
jgi:hypothetical protein